MADDAVGRRGDAEDEAGGAGGAGWIWRRSRFGRARRALADWIGDWSIWDLRAWERWAAADSARGRFVDEVLVRPTVGRTAAVVVATLVTLIAWLTRDCADGGVFGAPDDAGCEIPTEMSTIAIALVVGVVALAALEHLLAEPIRAWMRERRRRVAQWRRHWRWPTQLPLNVIPFVIRHVFSLVSIVISFVDWIFVRVLGWIAGASIAGYDKRLRRYGVFFGWLALLSASAFVLPPELGLAAVSFAIALVFAVARRWSWIERDREAFMVSRRSRSSRPVAHDRNERPVRPRVTRIGFGEDLRDEALFGIIALFFLTPLFLAQVDLASERDGSPSAFGVLTEAAERACAPNCGVANLEMAGTSDFLTWLGFFGGELAKSVPLVDWSEVFNVENRSPIKPSAALGAQVVFALRMTLDLLLIASILLALNIASRLRDRSRAFADKDLTILDPFAEWRAFSRLDGRLDAFNPSRFPNAGFKGSDDALDPIVGLGRNPALRDFDHYEPARLVEIALSADPSRSAPARATVDVRCRRAALATLAKAAPSVAFQAAGAHEEVGHAFADAEVDRAPVEALVADETALGAAARRLAMEAPPAQAAEPLLAMLASADEETQRDAAWRLGLSRREGDTEIRDALQALWANGRERARAQAALALTGLGWSFPADLGGDVENGLQKALEPLTDTTARLTLRSAAALPRGRLARDESFPAYLSTDEPTEQALAREVVAFASYGMRRVPAHRFTLGAPGSTGSGSFGDGGPPVEIDLEAFDLSATAVTLRQFRAFADAEERDMMGARVWTGSRWETKGDRDYRSPGFEQQDDHPVTCVNWWDAIAFCGWLSRVVGEQFRLPSEAEWEGACRGQRGSDRAYWWGDEAKDEFARFGGYQNRDDPKRVGTVSVKHDRNLPEQHPFGLDHMSGNTWEWCADPWRQSYRDHPKAPDPWLDSSGDFSLSVLRGGSWGSNPFGLRSAFRAWSDRRDRDDVIGFRVARTAVE